MAVVDVVDVASMIGLVAVGSVRWDTEGCSDGLVLYGEDRGFFCSGEKKKFIPLEDMSVVRLACRPSRGGGGK